MAKSFRKGEKEKRAAKWPEGKEEEKAQLYGIRGKKLRDGGHRKGKKLTKEKD